MTWFEGNRWTRNLFRNVGDRSTLLVHRDLTAKAGVKFEWLISQNNGKDEVKLSNKQMQDLVSLVQRWEEDEALHHNRSS